MFYKSLISLLYFVQRISLRIEEKIRCLEAKYHNSHEMHIQKYILEKDPPWANIYLPYCDIPRMISEEEKKYYIYISESYTGDGEVVELGPWLGCSTFFILQGLKDNQHFKSKNIYVFDDFIWRSSWMDIHYKESDRPRNHETFMPIFEKYTDDFKDFLNVKRCKISGDLLEESGNIVNPYFRDKNIKQIQWDDRKIELIFVDCGRTFDVNNSWYKIFSKSFIPNKTKIILQDWQTHKEIPHKWYNQIKMFTDSKANEIQLIHELKYGSTATFLYKGK